MNSEMIENSVRIHLLAEIMRHIDITFDLGAADGQWSDMFHNQFPNIKIVAVEPIPAFLLKLREKKYLYSIFECAINSTTIELDFDINENPYSSSLLYGTGEKKIRVKSRSLESIFEELKIDEEKIFIKSDLQGFDLKAIQSVGKFIKNIVAIQMECQMYPYAKGMNYLDDQIFEMSKLGYRVIDVFNLMDRPSDGLLGQIDLLFLKKESNFFKDIKW
jgi:FkbM family methyltransferase